MTRFIATIFTVDGKHTSIVMTEAETETLKKRFQEPNAVLQFNLDPGIQMIPVSSIASIKIIPD